VARKPTIPGSDAGQRRGRLSDAWAALALGIQSRGTNDPETCKMLRAAWDREKNADARAPTGWRAVS
jgi:hypothetical protein